MWTEDLLDQALPVEERHVDVADGRAHDVHAIRTDLHGRRVLDPDASEAIQCDLNRAGNGVRIDRAHGLDQDLSHHVGDLLLRRVKRHGVSLPFMVNDGGNLIRSPQIITIFDLRVNPEQRLWVSPGFPRASTLRCSAQYACRSRRLRPHSGTEHRARRRRRSPRSTRPGSRGSIPRCPRHSRASSLRLPTACRVSSAHAFKA